MTLRGQDRSIEDAFAGPQPDPSPVRRRRRRICLYGRVSSEEQERNDTIGTQLETLRAAFAREADVELVDEYLDEAVSGMIAFPDRPQGGRLMRDCRAGKIDEVWVTRWNRLGRKAVHILNANEMFESLGVKLHGVLEPANGMLMFTIMAGIAEEDRRVLLENTRAGLNRTAREGHHPGGIVAYGYRVEGEQKKSKWVLDDTIAWQTWTAVEVVRWIFHQSANERRSCYQIADTLNSMGVPTHYSRAAREIAYKKEGRRKEKTAGVWRPGRVRQILTNTSYYGEYRYGKKRKDDTEMIVSPVPPVVSRELWDAAQKTLADKRLFAKTIRSSHHLLKGRLVCGTCGLRYSGSWGVGKSWYRCNGRTGYRGKLNGRCPGRPIDGDIIEPQILDDICRWLRDPGDIVDELEAELRPDARAAVGETERLGVEDRLRGVERAQGRLVSSVASGALTDEEVGPQMKELRSQAERLRSRLAELDTELEQRRQTPPPSEDLRAALRLAVDAGLTREQQQELVGLLVRQIVVHTEPDGEGLPKLRCVVEYAFPLEAASVADCGAVNHTGRGSWRR